MSLRFVIGRAEVEKYTLFTRSARRVKTAPRGNNIISCARTDDIPNAAGVGGSEGC